MAGFTLRPPPPYGYPSFSSTFYNPTSDSHSHRGGGLPRTVRVPAAQPATPEGVRTDGRICTGLNLADGWDETIDKNMATDAGNSGGTSTTHTHAIDASNYSLDVPVQWDLIDLLRDPKSEQRFALIMLNQPIQPPIQNLRRLWRNAFTHIAADGGANILYEAAGRHRDPFFDNLAVIIGDLDSLSSEACLYFKNGSSSPTKTEVIHRPDQDSTDFAKAVDYVRERHGLPLDIVAVGGLGGRVDQGLSQLHHLQLYQQCPRYSEGRMYLYNTENLTFVLKAGRHEIRVREDDQSEDVFEKWVGILPVGEPSQITTKGLEWDVTDWQTKFGGRISTSNHILPDTRVVEVRTTKDVLFTVALRKR